jgi:hypothetical protein
MGAFGIHFIAAHLSRKMVYGHYINISKRKDLTYEISHEWPDRILACPRGYLLREYSQL